MQMNLHIVGYFGENYQNFLKYIQIEGDKCLTCALSVYIIVKELFEEVFL